MTKTNVLGAIVVVSVMFSIATAFANARAVELAVGQTLLVAVLIFWWYHLDKSEHHYRAGPLLNVGVAAVSFVALPVYFFRTRGWKGGGLLTLKAFAFIVALGVADVIIDYVAHAIPL